MPLSVPNPATGWEDHVDGTYTSGSPFAYTGGSGYASLPNDSAGALTRISQRPSDGIVLFSGGKITGRDGDGIGVNIEFVAVPDATPTPVLEVGIDIGGAVGVIHDRTITFPKGSGIARPVSYSHFAYTLDTWAANGGQPVISCNASLDIYDIRCVVFAVHRARM